MKEPSLTAPQRQGSDQAFETTLRPQRMSEFIGQEKARRNLSIFIEAARGRGEVLDHTLLYGPPGLGKTTLAHIIAREMNGRILGTSGPAIERPGDLAKIMTSVDLNAGDILFIDEIHRLHPQVEEVLYSAMEDFEVDIVLGKGAGARSVKLPLPHFTLIGATTRAGLLTSPLRNRFGVIGRLDFYEAGELYQIVRRSAHIFGIQIEDEAARCVAACSRGTPRIANRLLRRTRDYAEVRGNGVVTHAVATEALKLLDVDQRGLDAMDRKILKAILEKFDGGPVGLKTLSLAVNEEPDTIEEVYEPYLLREGLLQRTSKGRVATSLLYEYLGRRRPGTDQRRLFE